MSPYPLADRFPGVAALPRVGLVHAPTPVDNVGPMQLDEDLYIGGLWVKRDDLTSPLYGGNKVRKLEFLLGEALREGRRAVLTFGAYGSNHALATAVYATSLGLEPHVVLSPQAPGPFAARTLRAHAGLGTTLHLIDGWDGRRAAVAAKRELTARDGIEPAIIPMGGTSPLGALGYVNAALELLGQAKTLNLGLLEIQRGDFVRPDLVYVAAGTLGTAVGLAVGFAAAGARTKVVGVRVTPDEVGSDAIAEKLAADTIALLRSLDPDFPALAPDDLAFELRHDWFEPGYGVVTPETTEAVKLAAQHVKLETTYTGKAFAAMVDDARSGRLDPGDHVLFWDTYSSAPMPPEGADEALPPVLREYVAQCDQLFGRAE
jgi:1-aminocyclopropane-1-carboxylate deaminase/D-cysteine desulfhydrase-like pyridoxal-dependent ACC family enzyme